VIQIQNRADNEIREKLVEYYKDYIGRFVYLKKNDGVVCKGLFSEILPDGKLKIEGTYKESLIEPLDIREFTATPYKRGDSSAEQDL